MPTRIPVLVQVLPRQLMGIAKSRLECQSGQDRSGNTQLQGQFGMSSTMLFNRFIRKAPVLPCGSPFRTGLSAGTCHQAHGSSFHALGTERGGQPPSRLCGAAVPAPHRRRAGDSQPHSHRNTCSCLCRHLQTGLLSG